MNATIELNQINTLPVDTLAIVKDDMEPTKVFSLVIRDSFSNISNLEFKTSFVTLNDIPFCVLMVKVQNKLYKCPISFELPKEFNYLQNLAKLKYFNLYLISDKKEIHVIQIKNQDYKSLSKALIQVKNTSAFHPFFDIMDAKKRIINNYIDEDLWNI